MKKMISFILVALCLVSLGAAIDYMNTNYHKTPESALEELRQQSNAQVLPMPQNNLALLIDKKGDISIAFMKVERPFNLYKDFEVFRTPLNIYDADFEHKVLYTIGPWYIEYTFGLIQNENVKYTAYGKTVRKDNVRQVFSVEEAVNDASLKGLKLWYISGRTSSPDELKSNTLFLNKNKGLAEISQEEFLERGSKKEE